MCLELHGKSVGSQTGSALIIALVLSLMLTGFSIYLTTLVRQQLDVTQLFVDKSEAILKAESVASEWLFAQYQKQGGIAQPVFPEMVGRGAYKPEERVSVVEEDVASLVSLVPFRASEMKGLLEYYSVPSAQQERIVAQMQDWMDADSFARVNGYESSFIDRRFGVKPRNDYVQSLDEFKLLPAMDEELFAKIRHELVLYGVSERHPLNGSEAFMRLFIEQADLPTVMRELQNKDVVKAGLMGYVKGGDPQYVTALPPRRFRVTIDVKFGQAKHQIQFIVQLRETNLQAYFYGGWR